MRNGALFENHQDSHSARQKSGVPARFVFLLRKSAITLTLSLFSLTTSAGEKITVWVSHFPPYSAENLPGGGPAAQVVTRIFQVAGIDADLKFAKWEVVAEKLKSGNNLAFPYSRDAEKLKTFEFSEEVISPPGRYFVRATSPSKINPGEPWRDKTLCRPRGWAILKFESAIKKYNWSVKRPWSLEECFQLLKAGEADLVATGEPAGFEVLGELFGSTEGFKTLQDLTYEASLRLIIDRDNPKAQAFVTAFNNAMAQLRQSGEFDRILKSRGFNPDLKPTLPSPKSRGPKATPNTLAP